MGSILVFSKNKYLLGFFEGYCQQAGFQIKAIQNENTDFFFSAVKDNLPSMVFVDLSQSERIFNSPQWGEVKLLIRDNHIAFCGIGQWSINSEASEFVSFFSKVFMEPVNFGEILKYLSSKMEASLERRSHERRGKLERRNLLEDRKVKFPLNISCEGDMSEKVDVARNQNVETSVAAASLDDNYMLNDQYVSKQTRHLGSLSLDNIRKIVCVNDVPVEVSPKEFQLIELLMERPGRVVNVEEIIKKIWVGNKNATKADVHQYMYTLRHKLEREPHKPQLLVTVRGFGYKLCP